MDGRGDRGREGEREKERGRERERGKEREIEREGENYVLLPVNIKTIKESKPSVDR